MKPIDTTPPPVVVLSGPDSCPSTPRPQAEKPAVDTLASMRRQAPAIPPARQALDGAFAAAFGEPVRFRTHQRNDVAETLHRLCARIDAMETELAALRRLCESRQAALQITKDKQTAS